MFNQWAIIGMQTFEAGVPRFPDDPAAEPNSPAYATIPATIKASFVRRANAAGLHNLARVGVASSLGVQ
jgi:hypothetical protein